jgi:hypothetical protein
MAVASLAVSNVRRAVWNPTLRKNREGWCPLALACRRRFLISDFLDVAKKPVGVTRFKVVIRRFNRRFIGPAQGQNRSGAHPPQLFDNGLFIFERDGMPNNPPGRKSSVRKPGWYRRSRPPIRLQILRARASRRGFAITIHRTKWRVCAA